MMLHAQARTRRPSGTCWREPDGGRSDREIDDDVDDGREKRSEVAVPLPSDLSYSRLIFSPCFQLLPV